MRSAIFGSCFLTAFVLTFSLTTRVNAQSAPPNLVHFQARLADAGGTPLNGLLTVEVRAYTAPVGGVAVWSESQVVTALNGVVNLNLGSLVALPSTLFDPASLYLAVKVGADPEMTPRRQLISVPYARRAAAANALEATSTIPAGLITSSHILDGTIATADHGAASITNALLAANSVSSGNIVNGTIAPADIAAGAITNALLAANSVASGNIIDGTIATADIAASAITNALLAASSVASVNILDGTIVTADIAANAITGALILDATIASADIATGGVTGTDILDGTITAVDIAPNALTASELATDSVGFAEIATGAVTTFEILDATISTADIAPNAITAPLIAIDAVGAAEIADNSIDGGEVVDNSLTATDIADTLTGTIDFDVTGSYAIDIVNDGTIGIGDGLRAETQDASGYAVWAVSTNAGGGRGVYATSQAGTGVFGATSGATASNYGVFGTATSATAFAVFGSGDFGGTGTKYFINPHPTDSTKQVNFACLEGNESATFFRGSGTLTSGLLLIPVPEDFALVTEPDSLMVTATPVGAPAVVYVESQSLDGIVIRGNVDVKVNYMVTGTRLGHKGLQTIRENHSFVPEYRGIPFGSQYKPAYRQLLVKNGILNPDFTPNEATAARNGWVLKDPWTDIRSEHLLRGLVKMGEIKNPRPFPSARSQTANAQPVVQDEKALEGGGK